MKGKSKSFIILLILCFCISIGYAVLSKTFTITGNSEVKKNTWDIHFENVQINSGSVDAIKEPTIDNTNLSVDFNFMLNLPGDYYEFTVDVVNVGTIDAMIESVVKTPELTEEQTKYLNYIIEYQNKEQISSKQLLFKNNGFLRVKVRVEYRSDVQESDIPDINQSIDLGFKLNFIQADSTGIIVKDNGVFEIIANGSLEDIGTIVTIGEEQFYTIGIEGDNVKLLSMYNLYVGSECTTRDSSSCVPYGDEATGMQSSRAIGYNWDLKTDSLMFPFVGTTIFSNVEQHGANYSDYNGSVVERYVNNYKKELEKIGANIVEARLITYEELISEKIGCSEINFNCSNAPSFIYSTSYWTGSSQNIYHVWYVSTSVSFSNSYFDLDGTLGVRPVIVLSINDIKVKQKPVSNGSLDDIGTIVTIGEEQFYTIGMEGENVKLLSMYNLYVGSECTSSEASSCLAYGEEATGLQDSNMRGYVSVHDVRKGTTAYSNENQKGENYRDYSGSIVEKYVNNYKKEIEKIMGVKVEEARLITKEELIDDIIGCKEDQYTCGGAPAFIYSTTYWSMSFDENNKIWRVFSSGSLDTDYPNYEAFIGVRPVLVIPKSLF